jgi:hypothetical protein
MPLSAGNVEHAEPDASRFGRGRKSEREDRGDLMFGRSARYWHTWLIAFGVSKDETSVV